MFQIFSSNENKKSNSKHNLLDATGGTACFITMVISSLIKNSKLKELENLQKIENHIVNERKI